MLSQASNHPTDVDLSVGTPVKIESWGTQHPALVEDPQGENH
jgi:hypothetical protein